MSDQRAKRERKPLFEWSINKSQSRMRAKEKMHLEGNSDEKRRVKKVFSEEH